MKEYASLLEKKVGVGFKDNKTERKKNVKVGIYVNGSVLMAHRYLFINHEEFFRYG